MSELIDSILATAPKHEPEFETRLFDERGDLVALLPMEIKGRSLYVSEAYQGPERLVAVLIFRDGAPWRVVAQNLGVGTGFSMNATIPVPEFPRRRRIEKAPPRIAAAGSSRSGLGEESSRTF